jgi:cytochrome c-type biogenesis protein CcmH/NrfG
MRTGAARATALTVGLLWLAAPCRAVPPGAVAATEALAICDRADTMPKAERDAALARGEAMARAVLDADPNDARAHFALFCHLGRRMKHAGSLSALFALGPLKREIDTAQRLAPDDADVLAAKGALLLGLPRLFGGDPVEAERLLQRALVIEPSNTDARCYLAALLRARGETPQDVPPDC